MRPLLKLCIVLLLVNATRLSNDVTSSTDIFSGDSESESAEILELLDGDESDYRVKRNSSGNGTSEILTTLLTTPPVNTTIATTTLLVTTVPPTTKAPPSTATPAPNPENDDDTDTSTKKSSKKKNKNNVIIFAVCGVLFVIILIVVGVFVGRLIYGKCKGTKPSYVENHHQASGKNPASASNIQPSGPIFASDEIFKGKSVQLRRPAPRPNAPDHVAAETFQYKGPLVLQTQPPDEIPTVHELENDRPPSIHASHHIMFDTSMNEVHEIGSDVEVLLQGQAPLPRRQRSSLPSPYAEAGPKPPQKRVTAAVEARRDRAIRE